MGGSPSRAARKRFLRFEIAVDNPLPVRLVERRGELPHPVDDFARGWLAREGEALQVLPRQQLHDEEGGLLQLTGHVGVDNPHDVLALDGAVDARLSPETLNQLRGQQRPREHQLEGQGAPPC